VRRYDVRSKGSTSSGVGVEGRQGLEQLTPLAAAALLPVAVNPNEVEEPAAMEPL
jgi:hypothetical protein